MNTIEVKLSEILRDKGTQFRPEGIQKHVLTLMDSIDEEGMRTPLEVFKTPEGLVLVDGFHRYTAVKDLGWNTVDVNVVGEGSTLDAQLHALSSNSGHDVALTRDKETLQSYCKNACELILLKAEEDGKKVWKIDYKEVMELVKCGQRKASEIVQEKNSELRERRDEAILSLHDCGEMSNRAISKELDIPQKTVNRVINESESKLHSAKMTHPEEPKAHKEPHPLDDLLNTIKERGEPQPETLSFYGQELPFSQAMDIAKADPVIAKQIIKEEGEKRAPCLDEEYDSMLPQWKPTEFKPDVIQCFNMIINRFQSAQKTNQITVEEYEKYMSREDSPEWENAKPQIVNFVKAFIRFPELASLFNEDELSVLTAS